MPLLVLVVVLVEVHHLGQAGHLERDGALA